MAGRTTQRGARQRSRQVREAAIGTHVVNNSRKAARTRVNYSNPRGRMRAKQGEISQMLPETSTRESISSFSRRQNRTGLVEKEARRSRWRGFAILVGVLTVALLVALNVTRCTYSSQVSNNMHLDDEQALAMLAVPESEDAPFYTLVLGEYDDGSQTYSGPDLIMLVRADPVAKQMSIVSIPSSTEIVLPDNRNHRLADAQVYGGDAEMITQVHNLTGVDIAHIAKVNQEGFVHLVDVLGGVTVDVPEEVDDPDAGPIFIPAGTQTLNGEQALTLCRAKNYSDPIATRALAQANTFVSLLHALANASSIDFMAQLDTIAPDVKTDLDSEGVSQLFERFAQGTTFYEVSVPGSVYSGSEGTYFSVNSTALASLMEALNEGRDPNEALTQATVIPSQVSVTVRNGAGIAGGAARVAEELQAYGYQIYDTGNADSYVYDETLVVYADPADEVAAEDIVGILGSGRSVDASYYYSFDSDVLVVIGKDWKPLD